jgi:hypothetical protein
MCTQSFGNLKIRQKYDFFQSDSTQNIPKSLTSTMAFKTALDILDKTISYVIRVLKIKVRF